MKPQHLLPLYGLPRGLALALGGFALINIVGGMIKPGFDATVWWIDTRWLPRPIGMAFIVAVGTLLLWHGIRPARTGWRHKFTQRIALAASGIALINAVTYYSLLLRGVLFDGPWIPISLFVAAGLVAIAYLPAKPGGLRNHFTAAIVLIGVTGLGALGLMWSYGRTDYRRPADAIVVFGARAYADGRPSDALADRVNTAIDLYHQGYAPLLVMSGGPGDGSYHETDVMRNMAIQAGVPTDAIRVDRQGLNTAATVANTAELFDHTGVKHTLAVSHGYHLPRIQLTYQRAGVTAYTVPAKETYLLTAMPYMMAREVAAWWVYYIRPLA